MITRSKKNKFIFECLKCKKEKTAISPDFYILKLTDLFDFNKDCNKDFETIKILLLLRKGVMNTLILEKNVMKNHYSQKKISLVRLMINIRSKTQTCIGYGLSLTLKI